MDRILFARSSSELLASSGCDSRRCGVEEGVELARYLSGYLGIRLGNFLVKAIYGF